MRVMGRSKTSKAFALPTVLIASIVLLTILAVSVTATAAVRTTLKNQYYTQLAQVAGESGVAYAKACLAANGNIPQWSDAKPLTPATDCSGNLIASLNSSSCPSDPKCSVTVNDNIRSSFSVPKPNVDSNGQALTIPNSGYVDVLRTSNGAVWRTYKQPSVQAAVVPDLCSGNATAARGWGAAVKTTHQDSLPLASTAQTISLADAAVNAGVMYFRKDFNVSQAASYDLNVYTSNSQDIATTYIDGQLISTASGSISASMVPLNAGCHVLVTELTNVTVVPRASNFTASLTRSGAATPVAVTDSSWRVATGDPMHFSTNNYYEAPGYWSAVADRGTWNDASVSWASQTPTWSSVSGDPYAQFVSTQANASGTTAPGGTSALFRDTQPFTLTNPDTIRITTFCDDTCDLYLDGNLVTSGAYGVTSKSITIQPGTHTFGMRVNNNGSAGNPAGFLFSANDLTSGDIVARSSVEWDSMSSWGSTGVDSYSYDVTYQPTPAVLPSANAKVLVVGGGGGGGSEMGGGGGGGGVVYDATHSLSPGTYNVTVGAGGSGAPAGIAQRPGNTGGDSFFDTLHAYGGGGGGSNYASNDSPPGSGASAGGSAGAIQTLQAAPVIGQGSISALTPGSYYPTGGGGAGGNGATNPATGGIGVYNTILGSGYYFGGGGGGSGYTGIGGNGGAGGGGGGAVGTTTGGSGVNAGSPGGGGTTVTQTNKPGGDAGANTGGGGGGGSHYNSNNYGGDGGSGIVVIAVPTGSMSITASGASITTSGGYTIYRFNTSGTFTINSIS